MTEKYSWSKDSLKQMQGIHPDLRKLCDRALRLSRIDFRVIDGVRTLAEQRRHFNNGASKTMKSRHLHGYAVDLAALVGGKVRWEDVYYKPIREAFEKASAQLSIPIGKAIKWDMGHIELAKKEYPDP